MAAPASPRPVVADLQLVTPEKSTSAAKQAEHDLERMQSPPLNQLLDDLQLKSSNASAVVFRIVLTGGPCGGKCWGRGTPMRMYDGTVKPVELVRGGDQLMGDDGTARTVQFGSERVGHTAADELEHIRAGGSAATGEAAPATWKVEYGGDNATLESWTCNGDHILVLQFNERPSAIERSHDGEGYSYSTLVATVVDASSQRVSRRSHLFSSEVAAVSARSSALAQWTPLVVECSVNEFRTWDASVRDAARMFTAARCDFQLPPVTLAQQVESAAKEERVEFAEQLVTDTARFLGIYMSQQQQQSQPSQSQQADAIASNLSEAFRKNILAKVLPPPSTTTSTKSSSHGRIPEELLCDTVIVRRALLSGILHADIDVDAKQSSPVPSSSCDHTSGDWKVLTGLEASFRSDVTHLARGLGHVVHGSGASSEKDLRVSTAAAAADDDDSSLGRCVSFVLTRVGHAAYYGFTLDGNGRCLLGDFVVTHNTTAMGTLTERFQALGWRVFRVPEAATTLVSGGHMWAGVTPAMAYNFQATLLRLMISMEEAFIALARATHDKCIVLCDRGTMDCRTYMPEEEWEQLCKEVGMSTMQLRDERYDCVLHLVTAAHGADQYYSTEGHAARTEPPALARELDDRVKHNWVGHPHYHVVDNSTDFNGKIRRVMSTICQFVGLTGTVGMSKRKFLVNADCIQKMGDADSQKGDRIVFPEAIRYQKFEVDHDYILRPDQDKSHQLRLRRRGLNGQYTYSYTLRYPDLLGQRVELKRLVTRREYFDLLLQRDPTTQTVTKKRYSFLHNNTYMELDQLCWPHAGLYMLEFHTEKGRRIDLRDSPLFPDFLKIDREVTGDREYSMYNLAKKSHPSAVAAFASGDMSGSASPAMRDALNRSKSLAVTPTGDPSDMQQLMQKLAAAAAASPSAPNSPQQTRPTAGEQPPPADDF